MTSRRVRGPSRRTAIVGLLVLGGLALGASALTWSTSTGSTALDPEVVVAVTGTSAAPGVGAAALVVVASALALGLVGRVGRWVVLAVAAAAGVVITTSALAVVLDPGPSALSTAAESTGVTELTAPVTLTAAGWAAVVLGVLIVVLALWSAVVSGAWSQASTRHEIAPDPTSGPLAASAPPTGESAAAPSTGAAAAPPTGATTAAPTGAVETPRGDWDDHDAWDALSRGEDPTSR